ncbi:MAG: TRAP transporter large permease [Candidatus Methylomirabilales bacterium]
MAIFIGLLIMVGLLMIGIPIGPIMLGLGMAGGWLSYGWPFLESIGSVIWGVHNDNMLTAIPVFILMGELLLRSGIADGMYKGLSLWLTGLPGGLLHSNIACCSLFAATTGSSVACAATIGTVALPELDKRKYSKDQALGTLAAGGTLGILIPPSIALLVYGSLTNNSISKLFVGGVIPGIVLTLAMSAFVLAKNWGKAENREEAVSWRERLAAIPLLLPPFVVFFIVMGSIYFGIATPTEAAALGIATALIFAFQKGKLTIAMLHPAFIRTAQVTGMVLLIITGAFVLNLTLSMLGVAQALTKFVTDMHLSLTQLLLALIVFYIILGCFLDVLAMQVATIPIVYPIVTSLGGDAIWLGIFIVLMSEIGMITPPVGMNLFVIQGVRRDGGPLGDVIRGAWPYVVIMTAFTLLLIAFPGIVTWLPRQM